MRIRYRFRLLWTCDYYNGYEGASLIYRALSEALCIRFLHTNRRDAFLLPLSDTVHSAGIS
jgi:hypothetical protein